MRRFVRKAIRELAPNVVLIEEPRAVQRRAGAAVLATAALAAATELGAATECVPFRAACRCISGGSWAKRCVPILTARYPALARRLVREADADAKSSDLERDRRPLLGALAIAHAAALEHLKSHG